MITVTVTAQLGSGGRTLARSLADALGFPLVDRQVLTGAAAALDVPVEVVAQAEDYGPWWERLLGGVAAQPGLPELGQAAVMTHLALPLEVRRGAIRRQIEAWAARGQCVIFGHGAAAVLGQRPRTVHLLAFAPREYRTEALMRQDGLTLEEAWARIEESDRRDAGWFRSAHQCNLLDPSLYDVCLDLSRLSADAALRLAVQAATDRETCALPRLVPGAADQRPAAVGPRGGV